MTTAANREAIALGSQTATVENLYSVGNIRDEQELVTGTVTHKNAACIYDGTQPVGDRYISSTGAKDNGAIIIYPLETEYTGDSIISFTETVKQDVNSLEVSIESIQDLHGYDHPWPAGGGVNLFDANSVLTGYISNDSGALSPDYDSVASDYIAVTGGQTYRISPALSSGNWGAWYDENKVFISGISGYSTAKTAPSNAKYLRFTVSKGGNNPNYATTTQVETGSQSTSWTPYSNICPISGRTGLSVYVSPTQDQQDATTYAVDWTSEAGTVYGCHVNPVTGVLTVDYIKQTITSVSLWGFSNPNGTPVYVSVSGTNHNPTKLDVAKMKSNIFTYTQIGASTSPLYSYGANTGASETQTFILPSSVTTKAEANAWFEANPTECIFKLATPLTYQLTPTQVEALVGTNNIFSPDATSIKVAVSNPVIEYVAP